MTLGLFGKLPARRDFVAADVPRAFLTVWEDWLQAALPASQAALDEAWGEAYYAARPWRFWIGPGICGLTALGAFVSSYDGVGRQYPLTLVATGDVASPQDDPSEDWFTGVEALLRSAAVPGTDYARVLAARDGLLGPTPGSKAPQVAPTCTCWWTAPANPEGAPAIFTSDGMPPPELYASMLTGVLSPSTGWGEP